MPKATPLLKTTALLSVLCALTFSAQAADSNSNTETIMTYDIPNLQHSTDDLLTGGQPTPEALQNLKNDDYTVIINLRGVGENHAFDEAVLTEQLDLAYYTIPIAGADDLNSNNARALDEILARHDKQKILVHCASGNRVGALFALRAAWIQGESSETALEIGREHGLTSLEPQVVSLLENGPQK